MFFGNASISSLIFILVKCRPAILWYGCLHLLCNDDTLLSPQIEPNQSHLIKQMPETRINTGFRHFNPLFKLNSNIYMLWFVNFSKQVFCMFSLTILMIFWVCRIFCLHFADSFYKLVSKLVSFCNKLSVCNYYINHTILIL